MVLCPIAIAVGCRKCPVFAVCPVKSVIGDYKRDDPPEKEAARSPEPSPARAKRKPAANRKRARSRRPRK